ncbi:MAG: hypothetical protein ABFD54_08255 [Armatimonadota bacterium]|nr:hypothetical protein [bacterium]
MEYEPERRGYTGWGWGWLWIIIAILILFGLIWWWAWPWSWSNTGGNRRPAGRGPEQAPARDVIELPSAPNWVSLLE